MREGFREDATSEKIFENCSLYSKSSTRERDDLLKIQQERT